MDVVWVAARSMAARLLAVIAGSNPAEGMAGLSFVNVVCCQVEASATGRSLVQRSPIECEVCSCV